MIFQNTKEQVETVRLFRYNSLGNKAMTQTIENRKIYSLMEISSGISRAVSRAFPDYYWVKAEITKLNFYPKSGHCYPDLVEKQDRKSVV